MPEYLAPGGIEVNLIFINTDFIHVCICKYSVYIEECSLSATGEPLANRGVDQNLAVAQAAICDFGDGQLVGYTQTTDIPNWRDITSLTAYVENFDDCDIMNFNVNRFVYVGNPKIATGEESSYPDAITGFYSCDKLQKELRSSNGILQFNIFRQVSGSQVEGEYRLELIFVEGVYKQSVDFCGGYPGILLDDVPDATGTGSVDSVWDKQKYIFDYMGLIMLFVIVYYVIMAVYLGCVRKGKRGNKVNEVYDEVEDDETDSEMGLMIYK